MPNLTLLGLFEAPSFADALRFRSASSKLLTFPAIAR
jgi:hypothetical protein